MDHAILITTYLKTSLFALQDADHQVGTLDILATYLDGRIRPDKFNSGLISRMGGQVDRLNKKIDLTNGAVKGVLSMSGLGIGTILFNCVVRWAKSMALSLMSYLSRMPIPLPQEAITLGEISSTQALASVLPIGQTTKAL